MHQIRLFLVYSAMQFNEPVKVLSEVEGETITSQLFWHLPSEVSQGKES